jgi:pimeloyl-ACP methyl ester carboxylesterase
MKTLTLPRLLTAVAAAFILHAPAFAGPKDPKPTIFFVHGAFAESLSWEDVIARLQAKGYPVVAAANPLRGVKTDSAYIAAAAAAVPGPKVMVGHSYGGALISNAAVSNPDVKALVFVSAFAPENGEVIGELASKFPGSTLGSALAAPVVLPDGSKELSIQQPLYHEQFAADVPEMVAALLAATQRPVAEAAFTDKSGPPAWKTLPSYFIYGTGDKAIAPPLLAFMAQRAGSKHTVTVAGASHAIMASHPDDVVALIEEAASGGR